jgi:hypothetical protein
VVTGLVVNEQVSTPRQLRKKLRAILHNAERDGLEAQNRDGHPDFYGYLAGLIGHVPAANPRQAEQLLAARRVRCRDSPGKIRKNFRRCAYLLLGWETASPRARRAPARWRRELYRN